MIYHVCQLFKDGSLEFAQEVAHELIKCLGGIKGEDSNSLFSLIGTFLSLKLDLECLQAVLSVLA